MVFEDEKQKDLLQEMGKNIANFSSNFFKMGKLIGIEGNSEFIKPENGYGFKVSWIFNSKDFFPL